MASAVDIVNLALGNLGDTATVASIDPPEASVQAQLGARFYPVARDALLEMASWGFAMRRISLAAIDNPWTQWLYAYQIPSDCLNIVAVLPYDSTGDYEGIFETDFVPDPFDPQPPPIFYMPQEFATEVNKDGDKIILTNTESAILRYTTPVTDTTKFSPLFVVSLGWLLASMLAGPLIKGDAGAAEAKRCYEMFQVMERQAETSDAQQQIARPQPITPWIAGR